MKAYQSERLENAICHFAREHQKRAGRPPSQTIMYKYLAFFDFQILEETGQAPLDLDYVAMDFGPVPIDIYRERDGLRSDLFRFERAEGNKYIVKSVGRPNLDYFSDYEKQKMSDLIFIFARKHTSAETMSDSSHERIRAWRSAYDRRKNSPIDKADTFAGLDSKAKDELTPQEEHFLMSESLKRAGR